MSKWARNVSIGCVSIVIVLVGLFGIENKNSYAENEEPYEDEMTDALEAYENMDAQSQQQFVASFGQSAVSSLSGIDLSNMDLESALMAVQAERVKLLDKQLQEQIKEAQKRNDL